MSVKISVKKNSIINKKQTLTQLLNKTSTRNVTQSRKSDQKAWQNKIDKGWLDQLEKRVSAVNSPSHKSDLNEISIVLERDRDTVYDAKGNILDGGNVLKEKLLLLQAGNIPKGKPKKSALLDSQGNEKVMVWDVRNLLTK